MNLIDMNELERYRNEVMELSDRELLENIHIMLRIQQDMYYNSNKARDAESSFRNDIRDNFFGIDMEE